MIRKIILLTLLFETCFAQKDSVTYSFDTLNRGEFIQKVYFNNELGIMQKMTLSDKDSNKLVHNGFVFEYLQGVLKFKYHYRNDTLDGEWYSFYPNGMCKEISYMKNDSLNGLSIKFYNSGLVKSNGCYSNNSKVGVWSYYNAKGVLIKRGEYKKYVINDENIDSLVPFIDYWYQDKFVDLKEGIWYEYKEGGLEEVYYIKGVRQE